MFEQSQLIKHKSDLRLIIFFFQKTFSDLWYRAPSQSPNHAYTVLSRCRPYQRSDGVAVNDFNLKSSKTYLLGCNKIQHDNPDTKTRRPIVLSESKPTLTTSLESAKNIEQEKKFQIFRFLKQKSNDSGHTISNSSLQDVDEIDFSSSDLVRYMEEVNEDIA